MSDDDLIIMVLDRHMDILRDLVRETKISLRAAIADIENPFNGGVAPEAHYGFEQAIEDVTNLVTGMTENGDE